MVMLYGENLTILTKCFNKISDPLRGIQPVGTDWSRGLQEWSFAILLAQEWPLLALFLIEDLSLLR